MTTKLKVKKLFEDAKLPTREHATDSGADVYVYQFEKLFPLQEDENVKIGQKEDLVLKPMERVLIHTGISVTVGQGYEVQVRPRSGNALKRGLSVLNTPGTIDESYRGIVGVIIINLSSQKQTIKVGEKIAQLVVCPVSYAEIVEVDDLDKTERNEKGFGSTGN